jgi:hypothetical protein
VCERPITPGQTWKFTPEGGKVHYYCAEGAQRNPGPEYTTMKSRLDQEGAAIARRLHPGEFGQPVGRDYFRFKLYQDPEAVVPGWSGMLPREKQGAEKQLYSAYLRAAQRILAGGSVENPASLDLSWLQEGDTFAPDFGGQMLKQRVSLYRNSDGRELTVAVEDVLAFNSEPVRLSATSPYRREVGIWTTPIGPTRSRRGFLRDSRYSLVFEGVPGYAYGEKWRLRRVGVENPAGPTFHEAMVAAKSAGARIGDTSGFEPWLVKAKLDQRSPQVVEALRGEFWRGVEQGESPAAKGQATHRGIKIWKTAEGWKTAVEPESLFDSYREAKEFVEAQARNPRQDYVIQFFGHGYVMPFGVGGEAARRGKAEFTNDARRAAVFTRDQALSFVGPGTPYYGQVAVVKLSEALVAQRKFGMRNPHESCNPYDYETTAREFGMNLGGRGPRVQTVKAWVKKAQRQLDEHRAWLRSKGYEDDGVVEKMERKIRWWEIALEEYARKRRVA